MATKKVAVKHVTVPAPKVEEAVVETLPDPPAPLPPPPVPEPVAVVTCRCGSPYFVAPYLVQLFCDGHLTSVNPTEVPTVQYTCQGCGDTQTLGPLMERANG